MFDLHAYEQSKQHLIHQLDSAALAGNVDELLDTTTPSKPAVYDFSAMTVHRIHLDSSDQRLPECKRQIRELKADINAWLQSVYGPEWELRKPIDVIHAPEGDFDQQI